MNSKVYRKISPYIWNRRAVRQLTDDAKLLMMVIKTHPAGTSVGCLRHNPAGLAQEMGWSQPKLLTALDELTDAGIVLYEENLFWQTDFLELNRPESPNVVRNWAGCIAALPECDLLQTVIGAIVKCLEETGPAFVATWNNCWQKCSQIEVCEGELGADEGSEAEPKSPPKQGGTPSGKVSPILPESPAGKCVEASGKVVPSLPESSPAGSEKPSANQKQKQKQNLNTYHALTTPGGETLAGEDLAQFMAFWKAFDLSRGKAAAAAVWLKIADRHEQLQRIVLAAREEARQRDAWVAAKRTPCQAERWLNERRWEDYEIKPAPKPRHVQEAAKPTDEEHRRALAAMLKGLIQRNMRIPEKYLALKRELEAEGCLA